LLATEVKGRGSQLPTKAKEFEAGFIVGQMLFHIREKQLVERKIVSSSS